MSEYSDAQWMHILLQGLQYHVQLNIHQHTYRRSPVSLSVVTAAVRPTPEDPRPVVVMARGAVCRTYRSNCDLATDGSPMSRMLMSLYDKMNMNQNPDIIRQ